MIEPPAIQMAPDPAVPQRDILMDFNAMAHRLATRIGLTGGVEIDSCERAFVSYTIGKRVRVVYRVRSGGRGHHIAASSFLSSSRSERAYRRAMESCWSNGSLRPVLHDAELNTVFLTFPNDRRIDTLPAIAVPSPDLTCVTDGRWTRSSLVDYYPETSAVVRCLDNSDRVIGFAKVHAGEEGERTHQAQQAFVRAAQGSGLQLARPLGYAERYRTLLVEPMSGKSIRQLDGAELLIGLRGYGAALATLHSLPPIDVPAAPRSPLERLQRKARSIGLVRPDVERLSSELLRDLSVRWEEAVGEPVLVHGDTNENNAFLLGDRVGLIDFDRASLGSAGSDIGNFLALLRYLRTLGRVSSAAHRLREETFLSGYSSTRPLPDGSSLRVHIAVGLAERAFRAVTRIRPSALLQMPALLGEAKLLLEGRCE